MPTSLLNENSINILIIRLSAIGDIFHSFTVLSDIKAKYPNANIDWLVDEMFKEVATLSPLIDNLYTIPLKQWLKTSKIKTLFNLILWIKQFKKQSNIKRYDYIIDMHGLIKTAVLTKFLPGTSYGLNFESAKEKIWASIFYEHSYYVNKNQVAIKRFRSLVGQILNLNYQTPFNFKINISHNYNSIQNEYILLLHGSSKTKKLWSITNWTNLIEDLIKNTKYKIAITYSNNREENTVKQIVDNLQKKDNINDNNKLNYKQLLVIPTVNIKTFCQIVNQAKLVIGVDTGFSHLANLLHKPVVGIYKISNQHYGGLFTDHQTFNLICADDNNEHKFIQSIISTHNLLT